MKNQRISTFTLLAAAVISGCTTGDDTLAMSSSPRVAARFPIVVTNETTVEIVGSGFGKHGEVLLGDQPATVLSWSDEKVIIEAPRATTNACSTLRVVSSGIQSNELPLGYGQKNVWVPKHAFPTIMNYDHMTVWTGNELLLFSTATLGGYRYVPQYDTWLTLQMVRPSEAYPVGRVFWTGKELFIWGDKFGAWVDPIANRWSEPIDMSAGAPANPQSAAWGADAVFVYGGSEYCAEEACPKVPYSDGIFYDETWHELPPAPESFGRERPIILWTGTEFLVWGGMRISKGQEFPAEGGMAYRPSTKTWRLVETRAPIRNFIVQHAFWMNEKLLVVGQDLYGEATSRSMWIIDVASGTWKQVGDATDVGTESQIIASGSKVIVSGGLNLVNDEKEARFAIFDIESGMWESPPTPERIAARTGHALFSDGSAVYVIGGDSRSGTERGGGRYDFAAKRWTYIGSLENEPPLSAESDVVWTGSELLAYGTAHMGMKTRQGARYNPATDTWLPMPEPTGVGYDADVVWTGNDLFAWGGMASQYPDESYLTPVSTGALYNPHTNQWKVISTRNGPSARILPSLTAAGEDIIVWGGSVETGVGTEAYKRIDLRDGASFNVSTGQWSNVPASGSPTASERRLAVWSGSEMLVWGVHVAGSVTSPSAAAYDPVKRQWRKISPLPKQTWAEESMVSRSGDRIVYFSQYPQPTVLTYDPQLDEWIKHLISKDEMKATVGGVVTAPDKVFLFPEGWDFEPITGGLAINLMTGEHESMPAPCGFTEPYGIFNHYVWTGEHILSWGNGGVSTFFP